MLRIFQLLVLVLSMGGLFAPAVALADGGTVRAMHESAGLMISVFTSPAVLTAGEADISVLVQDAESRTAIADATVQVTVVPREHAFLAEQHEATAGLATNRLLKACHAQLEPGWHDVKVQVSHNQRTGRVAFAMLVGPAPTKAASFWPWFTWPAVPIALVAANLAYRRFRSRQPAIINGSKANASRAP